MPLIFNLRHLENHALTLEGEAPGSEFDLDGVDELIQIEKPVAYNLTLDRLGDSVLVRGRLRLQLECQCVRCLRPFQQNIELNDWICNLPLVGEDSVPVDNDHVDLTPFVREDILLAFPQHPLCESDCRGLTYENSASQQNEENLRIGEGSRIWAELDKLKL